MAEEPKKVQLQLKRDTVNRILKHKLYGKTYDDVLNKVFDKYEEGK